MKKLIAMLGVLVMLGGIVSCTCQAPQPMNYKGETR